MTPTLDPAAPHPEIAGLMRALHAKDWPAVTSFFTNLHTADEHLFTVRLVGEVPGVEAFLQEVTATTGSLLAQVLLASRHIELGWEARTAARAKHVSEEQWELFRHHLHKAEQLLIGVTAAREDLAAAWGLRLHVSTGLSLGINESRRRYNRLSEHHPHTFLAQTRMVQQLCPKWSGSWAEMHAFARECMLAAPEGGLNGSVVAEGHLERWLDLGKQEGSRYLRQPEVRQEMREAAARSVLHPAFRRTYGWVQAHGYFAMAFAVAGDREAAAPHFEAMGDFTTRLPWAYDGNASEVFATLRRFTLEGRAK